ALLGGRRILRDRTASRMPMEQVAWALPAAALSAPVRVGVQATRGAITFVADDGEAPALELPNTTPRLLEVSWPSGSDRVVQMVEAEAGSSVPVDPQVRRLTLRTLDGKEYLLARRSTPD